MTEWSVWESTTLGRRSPFLSTQQALAVQYCKYCDYKSLCSRGKRLCRMTFIGQARDKLTPRLIPHPACGHPASRYIVLSESVFVFLCFPSFFFDGYRFLLKFCYVDA